MNMNGPPENGPKGEKIVKGTKENSPVLFQQLKEAKRTVSRDTYAELLKGVNRTPGSVEGEDEVRALFIHLIGDRGFDFIKGHIKKLTDAEGLLRWDVGVITSDGSKEYSYMREEKGGKASRSAIHVTFFDKFGDPISGHCVAEYVNGGWESNPEFIGERGLEQIT